MSVALPKRIEELAERRAAEGGFKDATDYITRLIEADAGDAVDLHLEAALLEGLEGPDEELDIEAMRAEGRALIQVSRSGT